MISSQGKFSSEAGIEVSNKGGNIIDVFTAVSFAISVESAAKHWLRGVGSCFIMILRQWMSLQVLTLERWLH